MFCDGAGAGGNAKDGIVHDEAFVLRPPCNEYFVTVFFCLQAGGYNVMLLPLV
mgnify:CR=1 FL=1